MVFLSRVLMSEICKQTLLSLRKTTGHSFQHCKKALQESNNDVAQAVKWLEEESLKQGWKKLERTEARVTKEGILAIAGLQNIAAITEVNCETDFVSKNSELRGFAKNISQGLCSDYTKLQHQGVKTLPWGEISQMAFEGQSVEESRARLVAKIGEKLSLRQSVVVAAPEGEKIAARCHPEDAFGRYGAIVFYKGGNEQIAEKICRHIIGMKPTSVGSFEDLEKKVPAEEQETTQAPVDVKDELKLSDERLENEEEERQENIEETSEEENEQRLVLQNFVYDQDLKVGEVLKENDMEVTKFWRFECAEEVLESNP